MPEKIPFSFESLPSPAIATYDSLELIQGIGHLSLYGFWINEENGSASYKLTQDTSQASQIIRTSVASSYGTSYTKELDIDFDVELGRPLIVDGQFQGNIPISIHIDGVQTVGAYCNVIVKKYDGSTETTIASGESDNRGGQGANSYTSHLHAVAFDLPRTKLKKGEFLRITVEVWAQTTASTDTGDTAIGHDPRDRADATLFPTTGHTSTQLKFRVPVALEPVL